MNRQSWFILHKTSTAVKKNINDKRASAIKKEWIAVMRQRTRRKGRCGGCMYVGEGAGRGDIGWKGVALEQVIEKDDVCSIKSIGYSNYLAYF